MSESTQWEVTAADDVDIEEDAAASNPVFVAECKELQLVKRNGRSELHQAWEPLSFKQVFNKAKYDFRKDDYTHDWLMSHTKDGKLMGSQTAFGKVREAWGALGIPLTRNEAFRPLTVGGIFTVTRVRDPYASYDSLDKTAQELFQQNFKDCSADEQREVRGKADKDKASFYIKPLEKLESYTAPANPKVQRYGFEASGVEDAPKATPQQEAALKSATNGKGVEELIDALIDSGNNMIICEPFMSEAGSGALLERLEALGGKVVKGNVYFAEVA